MSILLYIQGLGETFSPSSELKLSISSNLDESDYINDIISISLIRALLLEI